MSIKMFAFFIFILHHSQEALFHNKKTFLQLTLLIKYLVLKLFIFIFKAKQKNNKVVLSLFFQRKTNKLSV